MTSDTNNLSDVEKKRWQLEVEGFTYFDSWDEIWAWSEDKVDPISISNTPLLERPHTASSLHSSNVLIMHDYKGAYVKNNYEGWQSVFLDTEEYWLEQWQHVEIFNYFTHHRVAIPPPAWTNTAHRNGALVLGTFCIEPDSSRDVHSEFILAKDTNGRYRLANFLERIAISYGFDGWLINVETRINDTEDIWNDGHSLAAMLRQLRRGLEKLPSQGKVIWCACPHIDGRSITNGIKAAGAIITNYGWSLSEHVKPAVQFLRNQRQQPYFDPKEPALGPKDVYFGVDCFAQTGYSRTSSIRYAFGHDRVGDEGQSSYGLGHGGTATGLAISAIGPYRFGAGIFAPAYAYEHFPQGRDANRFTWEGQPVLRGPPCGCKEGVDKCLEGFKQHMRQDIKDNSIKLSASEAPCGSNSFFYTDYTEAFVEVDRKWKAQLGQQSILPMNSERSAEVKAASNGKTVGTMAVQIGTSSCRVELKLTDLTIPATDIEVTGRLVLHKLNIGGGKSPDPRYLKITYERLETDLRIRIAQFITMGDKDYTQDLDSIQGKTSQACNIERWGNGTITAIGLTIKGPASVFSKAIASCLVIHEMGIQRGQYDLPNKVDSIELQRHGSGITSHVRLSWKCEKCRPNQSLPFSNITGAISFFDISANNQLLGRAYGYQFVLDPKIYEGWKQKEKSITFAVKGHAFDGTDMIPTSSKLSLI